MERFGLIENGTLRLPPGFRFQPTDEELIVHYLNPKIQCIPMHHSFPEANVFRSDPWSLPGHIQQERYFFSTVETKHSHGKRTCRTTPTGHWRASGLPKEVVNSRKILIGTRKTFVFYVSKPGNGCKTEWIMHEYRVANPIQGMQEWLIGKVFIKKGAKGDVLLDVDVIRVRNTGTIPRNFDLNMDGGVSSSVGSCEGTAEDDENNK